MSDPWAPEKAPPNAPDRRLILFAGVGALALVAVLLTALGREGGEEPTPTTRQAAELPTRTERLEHQIAQIEAEHAHRAKRHAERLEPAGEHDFHPKGAERQREIGAQAEPAARDFLLAFLHYEVGELTPAVRAALKRTATATFARVLLRMPPRLARGADTPSRGEVTDRFQWVAGEPNASGTDLRTGEFVVPIRRAGQSTVTTVEMERDGGRWLVAGLG